MSDLQNGFGSIEEKTSNLMSVCFELMHEWEDLVDGIAEERWDCNQFKKTVLKTYEYFKSLYELSDMQGENGSYLPLGGCELQIIAEVYAYGRAECFLPMPSKGDYDCYASHFIATALYGAITERNLRPWVDQELYTVMDEFKYCSPDSKAFVFQYNVKTGDMSDIVDIIKLFDESGWLYQPHCRNYILPDAGFIEKLKESLASDE